MGNVFLSYVYPNHFWSLSRWGSIQLGGSRGRGFKSRRSDW
jgi:hypothetical protein